RSSSMMSLTPSPSRCSVPWGGCRRSSEGVIGMAMTQALGSDLTFAPMSPACGVVVAGIDLTIPQDGSVIAALDHAAHTHGFLVFRDQAITPAQHVALGQRFGPLHVHPLTPS